MARVRRHHPADHPFARRSSDARRPYRRDVGSARSHAGDHRDAVERRARQSRGRNPALRRDLGAAVAAAARGIHARDGRRAMTPGRVRLALAVALVLLLEALCRSGVIDRFSMIPPSEIVWHLGRILTGREMWPAISKTLAN